MVLTTQGSVRKGVTGGMSEADVSRIMGEPRERTGKTLLVWDDDRGRAVLTFESGAIKQMPGGDPDRWVAAKGIVGGMSESEVVRILGEPKERSAFSQFFYYGEDGGRAILGFTGGRLKEVDFQADW